MRDSDVVRQLLDLVKEQEKEIQVLKKRIQRFEDHGLATMFAFRAFGSVLAARNIARLDDLAIVLQSIIDEATNQGRSEETIRFLQGIQKIVLTSSGLSEDKPH
jgi:hypothetical protein